MNSNKVMSLSPFWPSLAILGISVSGHWRGMHSQWLRCCLRPWSPSLWNTAVVT